MAEAETGLIRHKDNEDRIERWGFHCIWPPLWPKPSEDLVQLMAQQAQSELEDYRQGAYQQKVMQALRTLFAIDVDQMNLETIMELSREHFFWIDEKGNVGKWGSRLW